VSPRADRTILVVGHPNVVSHNQLVYIRLAELGWRLRIIVPNRWVDEYSPDGFEPQPYDERVQTFARVRVAFRGLYQRHIYVTRPERWLERWRPDVTFIENDPFAIPALEWGFACQRLGVPWGLQGDENLDRPFPVPARLIRAWVTPRAHFYAARSPTGGEMLRRWGARAPIAIVPHTIPEWLPEPKPERALFTIGFAGRLVELKGIDDLLDAVKRLPFDFRLLIVGDGPLRDRVQSADLGRGELELRTGLRSDEMPALYREMDVLVLPSRTTPTWAEQFGKVLCEALLCGTPVIGSASGEIPWVVNTTGGGLLFSERNVGELAACIRRMREDPDERRAFAEAGLAGTLEHFSPRAAARALNDLIETALS
jgi:glycosyltransferase involved in cell wall biosynthesis